MENQGTHGHYSPEVRAPDERLGASVVLGDEAVDRDLEVDDGMKDAVFQPSPISGNFGGTAISGTGNFGHSILNCPPDLITPPPRRHP